ncbi:MAG TPA: SIS domain-containing protein [Candidatus Paceibacterota bacterium]
MINPWLVQFSNQFSFKPELQNGEKLQPWKQAVVAGMGGSHLAADFLNTIRPSLNLFVHKDYGLPPLPPEIAKETLFIASSYSGNTEETLSFLQEALKQQYSVAAITSGGALLQIAKEQGIPYVVLPQGGIPPRVATGWSTLALAVLIGAKDICEELHTLQNLLRPETAAEAGKTLTHTLVGKIPLIYASRKNFSLAYYWKITLNETAKIPAFCNMLPEANHNEIEGFDGGSKNPKLPLHVILLRDSEDNPRIQKRMNVIEELYLKRGLSLANVALRGSSTSERVFDSALLAIATALFLAESYGNESDRTPLIEVFKARMK